MSLLDRFEALAPGQGRLATQLLARSDRSAVHGSDGQRYLAHILDVADDLAGLATRPDAVKLAVWFGRTGPAPN